MEELKLYLNKLENKYANKVKLNKSDLLDEQLKIVPKSLHDFYKIVSQAEFPFGRIFSIDRALKESERLPFKPKWFVFGRDNYFSFWLCSYNKDLEGLSFTYWDHTSESVIDGAIGEDILSFLKYVEEEYNNMIL